MMAAAAGLGLTVGAGMYWKPDGSVGGCEPSPSQLRWRRYLEGMEVKRGLLSVDKKNKNYFL